MAYDESSETALLDGDGAKLEYTHDNIPRDDKDCVLVVILPIKNSEASGETMPLKQAQEGLKTIFATNCVPDETNLKILRDAAKELKTQCVGGAAQGGERGVVTRSDYQDLIRRTIKKLLKKSGIDTESFTSIDKDEVFLKLKFTDTSVLETYAERVLYKMPYTEETYTKIQSYILGAERVSHGERKSGRHVLLMEDDESAQTLPTNKSGSVVAYSDFRRKSRMSRPSVASRGFLETEDPISPGSPMAGMQVFEGAEFQDFRQVDQVRLMYLRLKELCDLKALEAEGIIIRHFPATQVEDVQKLAHEWIGGLHCLQVAKATFSPSQWCGRYKVVETMDAVRNFFGEQIGFYFLYYRLYLAMLLVLSLLSIPFWISDFVDDDQLGSVGSFIRLWKEHFGDILTIWASFWVPVFQRTIYRAAQRWGMRDFQKSFELSRKDYNPQIVGFRAVMRNFLSYFLLLSFCSIFLGALVVVMVKVDDEWESVATSTLIKVFSFAWSKIAKVLVQLQNHRVDSTFVSELSIFLVVGKLFLYLFPFMKMTFLDNFLKKTCAQSLEKLAHQVFDVKLGGKWPTGVDKEKVHEWFPEYTYRVHRTMLDFNQTTDMIFSGKPSSDANLLGVAEAATTGVADFRTTVTDDVCAYGCVPKTCRLDDSGLGSAICETDCYHDLHRSLSTLYLFHVATTFVFVLIPIFLAWWDVESERRKAEKEVDQPDDDGRMTTKQTTTLQIQAKKHINAPYEYLQWGGSFVEDILELILGHALLVCFGIFLPRLAIFAFLCNLVEYNLIAYRMLNVTGRPYPLPASGIGLWVSILDFIGLIGALVNGGMLAYFIRNSYSRETPKDKLVAFFMTSGWFLGLRLVCRRFFLPEEPWDVMQADYRNEEFKQQLNSVAALSVPESKLDANISFSAPPPPRKMPKNRSFSATASTTASYNNRAGSMP
mmetsp:Transcript_32519/g.76405  ORF Transcript_32519/g.76405 Transcript_32519/m.76405 type:complete len:938 (+) Transcript_32519:76-2889(+)